MPEQASLPPEEDAATPEPTPAAGGSSILSKLYVAMFLAGVVGVECLVAYLYIPSPAETAAMAGVTTGTEPESGSPPEMGEEAGGELGDQVEIDLGKFSVVSYQPVSNTTLRIDFHLYGAVSAHDKAKFEEAWRDNTHRFRDQVIVTVRGCDLTELTDAGLGLIKRKILEKTNRILGKPLLQAVIFSDFSFIEQ